MRITHLLQRPGSLFIHHSASPPPSLPHCSPLSSAGGTDGRRRCSVSFFLQRASQDRRKRRSSPRQDPHRSLSGSPPPPRCSSLFIRVCPQPGLSFFVDYLFIYLLVFFHGSRRFGASLRVAWIKPPPHLQWFEHESCPGGCAARLLRFLAAELLKMRLHGGTGAGTCPGSVPAWLGSSR